MRNKTTLHTGQTILTPTGRICKVLSIGFGGAWVRQTGETEGCENEGMWGKGTQISRSAEVEILKG